MSILDPVTVGRHAAEAGFRDAKLLAQMIAIAFTESGFNPDAVNKSSGATGLWQILPSAHPEFHGQNLRDPAVNARAAYSVYHSAPNPDRITKNKWTSYESGAYYLALPAATAAVPAALAAAGAAGAVDTVTEGLTAPVRLAGGIWDTLSSPRTWLRVGYAVLGVALVVVAVGDLTTGTVVQTATRRVTRSMTAPRRTRPHKPPSPPPKPREPWKDLPVT